MELQQKITLLLQDLHAQATEMQGKVEHGDKKEKGYYLGYLHGIQKALHDLEQVRIALLSKEIRF
jgi:hypothetical protein